MTLSRTIVAVALCVTSLTMCGSREATSTPFDRATAAASSGDFKEAGKLFATAVESEPEPARREEAALRLANLEWRALRKHDEARARLARLAATAAKPFPVHLEAARAATADHDYAAARAATQRAADVAKTGVERRRAAVAWARVVVDSAMRNVLERQGPAADQAELRETMAALRNVIAIEGPKTEAARLLARAALLAGDGAAALEGISGYYHVSSVQPAPQLIATAHAALVRLLPVWRGADTAAADRDALIDALAGVRFFPEALIVGQMAGSAAPAARVRDVLAYGSALQRIELVVNEYYRQAALGGESGDQLRGRVMAEFRALWPRLSWPTAGPPRLTFESAQAEIGRRFGGYVILGKTGGHFDTHFAHKVIDRELRIEQYGRTGKVRFIALDGVVSNGFSQWLSDGASGDGGWGTAAEIIQVRPLYANGALRDWLRLTDPEVRTEWLQDVQEKSKRDVSSAAAGEIRTLPGLALRLRRQYLESLVAGLRAQSLSGDALREAFLARAEGDEFHYSIILHEGRHAVDAASGATFDTWELEYRAKLSQVALSEAPRPAIASVVEDVVGGDSPHGKANERLLTDLSAWMRAHAAEVAGLDASAPFLPQLDKLSDAQIREAVRSRDPLARSVAVPGR